MKKFLFLLLFLNVSISFSQENKPETSKEFQDKLNKEYADAKESPLMKEDLADFKGLDFFPIDAAYIVSAKFVKSKNEKVFQMKTSTSRLPEYKKYGELHFTLNGKELKLNVYQNMDLIQREGYEDYLFLPFSDLTNGKESYIGGRYIDMRIQKGKTWTIDFNKAYNPYCAYNHKYSCPKVPLENDLPIEVKAGVKKFHD
ncbi:DUF1684 domain-containing protein [Flavobacterium capsici]|uniref:DUF1684 domain-containing protein n=1 Tax=Flavobacterium capsici TaxID=3075618 RepID=A0AA96J1E3_9FLAO|nr:MULTISPECIES: DUF1684 domain-containing protein [unclassified Flavobacterium]WNM18252.1 DUF1684 domain-containing protein [Flavobacterium sp. PMR2A8]WNM22303.1 DUF1684 domain-containing protein [Flavobacterium sp. PMTSA4]